MSKVTDISMSFATAAAMTSWLVSEGFVQKKDEETVTSALKLCISNYEKELLADVDDAVTSLENTLAGKKLGYEVQSYGVSVPFKDGAKPESFSEAVKADLTGANGIEAHLAAVKKHYPERLDEKK